MAKSNLPALACALGLLLPTTAHAFCRTTTCDPGDSTAADACTYDETTGCTSNGLPLYWAPACVAFSVQKDASPLRAITFETMDAVVKDALYKWSHVDCGGGQLPTIQLFDRSPVNCNLVAYNRDPEQPNANIWLFRDGDWPHPGSGTLALTTVTFNPQTGEIYDADVELNTADNRITVGDTDIAFDLKSIVIHEAGHTVGLSHSDAIYSTMFAEYSPRDISLRTLSDDDIAGICAVYPADRQLGACDPTPRHGFSTECQVTPSEGCALEQPVRPSPWGLGALIGCGVAGSAVLRRRRRRPA